MENQEFIDLLQAMRGASGEELEDCQKKLYSELWPRLFGFLRVVFPDLRDSDYEQVTEDSIIKVFMSIDQYGYSGAFISWCLVIARNTMNDFLKRSSTKLTVLTSFEEVKRQIEADPSEDAVRERNILLLDKLDKVLEGLGEECKLIIWLRFWWKVSREGIAKWLGISEFALRKRQEECFESVREMLYVLLNE